MGRSSIIDFAAAPDGTIWATQRNSRELLHFYPKRRLDRLRLHTSGIPFHIAVNSHGSLFLTEAGIAPTGEQGIDIPIVAVVTRGRCHEIPLPSQFRHAYAVTAAPGGAFWFTVRRLALRDVMNLEVLDDFLFRGG
jgi:streptogramin lyase